MITKIKIVEEDIIVPCLLIAHWTDNNGKMIFALTVSTNSKISDRATSDVWIQQRNSKREIVIPKKICKVSFVKTISDEDWDDNKKFKFIVLTEK